MINKILKICGIIFIVLVVIGLLGSIFLVSLSGARQKASYTPSGLGLAPETLFETKETEKESPELGIDRLVIKTGAINIVVKDIESSLRNIMKYAENKGGWVVSSSLTEIKEAPSAGVTVRIPAKIFDEAMVYFRGLAERVSYEGSQGQDVTEEYTDLQSQLRNLEATEIQLLKIMERSGTITEVLNVQRELTNVRGQIEQLKGRIQYLERSAEMSTITVNLALSEELLPIPPGEKWRPKYILLQAWQSVLKSLKGISYLLIWIVVYAVIWVPLLIIGWQFRKFWKKRKREKIIT